MLGRAPLRSRRRSQTASFTHSGGEFEALERRFDGSEIDTRRHRLVRGEPLFPALAVRQFVDVVFIAIRTVRDLQQHVACNPRMQVCRHARDPGAPEMHAAGHLCADLERTHRCELRSRDMAFPDLGELGGERRFETARAWEEPVEKEGRHGVLMRTGKGGIVLCAPAHATARFAYGRAILRETRISGAIGSSIARQDETRVTVRRNFYDGVWGAARKISKTRKGALPVSTMKEIEELVAAARAAALRQDRKEAVSLWRRVVERVSSDVHHAFELTNVLVQSGEAALAIELCERCAALDPDSVLIRLQAGIIHANHGGLPGYRQSAIEWFTAALYLEPANHEAHAALAQIHLFAAAARNHALPRKASAHSRRFPTRVAYPRTLFLRLARFRRASA